MRGKHTNEHQNHLEMWQGDYTSYKRGQQCPEVLQSSKENWIHCTNMGFIPKGTIERDRQSLAAKFLLHHKYDNGTNNRIKGSKRCIFSQALREGCLTRVMSCLFLNEHLFLSFHFPPQGHCLPLPTLLQDVENTKTESIAWNFHLGSTISPLCPSPSGQTKSFL